MSKLEVLAKEAMGNIFAKSMPIGGTFKRPCGNDLYMRILPSKIMMNSSMIRDIYERGKVFVVNLNTGAFYFLEPVTPVLPTSSSKLVYEV